MYCHLGCACSWQVVKGGKRAGNPDPNCKLSCSKLQKRQIHKGYKHFCGHLITTFTGDTSGEPNIVRMPRSIGESEQSASFSMEMVDQLDETSEFELDNFLRCIKDEVQKEIFKDQVISELKNEMKHDIKKEVVDELKQEWKCELRKTWLEEIKSRFTDELQHDLGFLLE
ncbi:hypothetical protein HYPBUDRAFT_222264 [Hyphopichia burtonii NRRL Y-1933]|uniref:Uncharacterized protein n=1 Tax=Hyphopichia burtonii NRRL Y-1933 TaxID=984485 RepID=A0A1E4RFQ6_9ASCO|nr:hypothetical protein HYPBUDRAFT_222264 [Hyphopichia burtonii NRRL Y-1933]ODV66088.1 hypothetical protein HYPBUDRAFT_222264 [Hyphopichia burtonii NRRL Y-1933]